MATANAPSAGEGGGGGGGGGVEEAAARALTKRYDGLVMVREKAIRGKGAWYWAHLQPILVSSSDTGIPKAVKLRCSLCEALFSASNPSRTASEHLKRGTCPNFSSPSSSNPAAATTSSPKPLSSLPPALLPCSSSHQHQHHHHHHNSRKRSSTTSSSPISTLPFHPLALVVPTSAEVPQPSPLPQPPPPPPPHHQHQQQQQLVLSGGKEDLGALAMLEDSVKRLKSPKSSPGPALSKPQADAALGLLSDWVLESCGAVSPSALHHPKFLSFLRHIGLPPTPSPFSSSHLLRRFNDAVLLSNARLRDALFFQLSSHGWHASNSAAGDGLVTITVNLPNGTAVFRRAVFTHGGPPPSKYAEDVLWHAVSSLCPSDDDDHNGDSALHRCVGIVADRFKSKALRDLESSHRWMVNLPCQLQAFRSLLKDFAGEMSIFREVSAAASKLANYFNSTSPARSLLHKHQLLELDNAGLLRSLPPRFEPATDFAPVFAMLDDLLANVRPLQLVILDESYKLACLEDSNAREMAEMIGDVRFWNELEAVHSLTRLVMEMAKDLEDERPLVGHCLPLWEELRSKAKNWCSKFDIDHSPIEKVIEKRFKKNYHPAWSAAFILDPLYLTKDASGKYLPPFKCLTPEQEKDVDRLITRLVSREEAHIALMELMKWRSEGMDPIYAQAVQVKQLDPATGKMRIAHPQSSRLVWETRLSEFKLLGKVAVRLIFLQATSCSYKCSPSLLRWVSAHGRSLAAIDRAQKMIFVSANAKLERKDFSNDDEKDAEIFAAEGDDDVLSEAAFLDAPSSV